jgi:rhamnosyltransferase
MKTHKNKYQKVICIPTKNAGNQIKTLLEELRSQTIVADVILVIDSSSRDNTIEIAKEYECLVHLIPETEFNHGATRNLARRLINADIYIFLTHDIVPANQYLIEKLITPIIENKTIGLTYGRQLPRKEAGPIEAFSRMFNYPETSLLKKKADANKLGIFTAFCSDACAAYRGEALDVVGGFPLDVIGSEDIFVGAKILNAGYKIEYAADAMVYHSHDYSIWQEFNRYFDIGVLYESRERWIIDEFGKTGSEGLKFLLGGFHYLKQTGHPYLIPEWFTRTLVKFCAYQLGAREKYLPIKLKTCLSMHKAYWQKNTT